MQQDKEWFPITKANLVLPGFVSRGTVWNWANRGVMSEKAGRRVYLKTKQVGGRKLTCVDYYKQFIRELNGGEE